MVFQGAGGAKDDDCGCADAGWAVLGWAGGGAGAGPAGAGWASATGPAPAPAPGSRAAAAVTFWPSVIALSPCADTSTLPLSHRSSWFPLATRGRGARHDHSASDPPPVTDIAESLLVTTVLPRSRVTCCGHYVPTGQSTHHDERNRDPRALSLPPKSPREIPRGDRWLSLVLGLRLGIESSPGSESPIAGA